MKVLFDTNVILDVLLDREAFADDAAYLMSKVELSEIQGFLCATTITTIHYIIAKSLGSKPASKHVATLLSLFSIAPVNRLVLQKSISSRFKDFEDAVLHESALYSGAQYIVTRNSIDFKKSKLPILKPNELISLLNTLE